MFQIFLKEWWHFVEFWTFYKMCHNRPFSPLPLDLSQLFSRSVNLDRIVFKIIKLRMFGKSNFMRNLVLQFFSVLDVVVGEILLFAIAKIVKFLEIVRDQFLAFVVSIDQDLVFVKVLVEVAVAVVLVLHDLHGVQVDVGHVDGSAEGGEADV